MTIYRNDELPLVKVNLNDIEAIVKLLSDRVRLHDYRKKVHLTIRINSNEFDTIEKAQQFIQHYDTVIRKHDGRSLAESLEAIHIETRCHDEDVKSYIERGYRVLEVRITDRNVIVMTYGDARTSASWVYAEAALIENFMNQFAIKKPMIPMPVIATSSVLGSSAMLVGGITAGLMISPLFFPLVGFGAASMWFSQKSLGRKSTNKISFLPPPECQADVLVNQVR